jgi:hypothetical protein
MGCLLKRAAIRPETALCHVDGAHLSHGRCTVGEYDPSRPRGVCGLVTARGGARGNTTKEHVLDDVAAAPDRDQRDRAGRARPRDRGRLHPLPRPSRRRPPGRDPGHCRSADNIPQPRDQLQLRAERAAVRQLRQRRRPDRHRLREPLPRLRPASTLRVNQSVRSGARNTLVCPGRYFDMYYGEPAQGPVNQNNTGLPGSDPRC